MLTCSDCRTAMFANIFTHYWLSPFVDEQRKSDVSTMPEGLLDTFKRDEILDLLAFLQSAER